MCCENGTEEKLRKQNKPEGTYSTDHFTTGMKVNKSSHSITHVSLHLGPL